VLLASAASGGTLASVRLFGREGIETHVVSSARLGAAAWSRHASHTYSAPPETRSSQFLDRIIEIGAATPGMVLLPTSDQTAWLFATHADELRRHFNTYLPSPDSIRRILDKGLLANAASNAGVPSLPTWDPLSISHLTSLSQTLPYPILIKPRSHVERLSNDKGVVVETAAELVKKYRTVCEREFRNSDEEKLDHRPILQPFIVDGSKRVQSVTGFIDKTGELFVTRRSVKVFQRSQPIGVGICHESLPPSPMLSDAVYALCRELQYFGLFEVEFVERDREWAVIDFNPRLYNQIGLDIRRGMPLPLMVFLDAAGQVEALRELVMKARNPEQKQYVFSDRFTMNAVLLAQQIFFRSSREERHAWRQWQRRHAANAVDVALDPEDQIPGLIHAISEMSLGLNALPRFIRTRAGVSFVAEPAVRKELSP
jgi:predicted ATP-grasp superfamily ATP-dependent carboligase